MSTAAAIVRRQRLIAIPTHSEEEKHGMAVVGFYGLGPAGRSAVPTLTGLLKHADANVRSTAARCLGAVGPGAEEAVRALTECLSQALNTGSDSQETASLIENAATALGLIGPSARPAIPILALATNASSGDVRKAAVVALIQINGDSVLPLIDQLKDTSDPIKWQQQAMLVSEFGTNAEPAIPLLIAALTNSSDIVVGEAATALARIHGQPGVCVSALIPLLSSPSVSRRQKSLSALGAFGSDTISAVPAIARCLADSDPWVGMQATNMLRAIDPEAAAKAGVK